MYEASPGPLHPVDLTPLLDATWRLMLDMLLGAAGVSLVVLLFVAATAAIVGYKPASDVLLSALRSVRLPG